jgi:hypothetical protein
VITQLEPELSSIPEPEPEPIPDISSLLEPEPEPEPIPDISSLLEPEPEPIQEAEPRPEVISKQNIRIMDVEGIGYVYSEKLKEAGILYVHELLDACATRKRREDLAEIIGISQNLLSDWINLAEKALARRERSQPYLYYDDFSQELPTSQDDPRQY